MECLKGYGEKKMGHSIKGKEMEVKAGKRREILCSLGSGGA